MEELWRLSPEPVLCFDGDAAGARAAARAAETALPLLSAERTLRLATLTGGEDPDTLVTKGGPAAFQAVLASARPLSEALYGLIAEGRPAVTPEQRAALRNRLSAVAATIPDKALAAEYRRSLLDRFFAATRAAPRGGPARKAVPARPRPAIDPLRVREAQARALLAITLSHPWLLHEVEESLGVLDLGTGLLMQCRNLIFAWLAAAPELDSDGLMDHLAKSGMGEFVAALLRDPGMPAAAGPDAQPKEALDAWWHFFGLLRGEAELVEDRDAAQRAFAESNDPAVQQRLIRVTEALGALRRGEWAEAETATGSGVPGSTP
jgi:DNA primase